MAEYTFTKEVQNVDALKWYLVKNFDLIDENRDISFTNDENGIILTVTIYTTKVVPDERISVLNTLVANYTHPVYYLPGVNHVETYPIFTNTYSGVSTFPIYSWIIPYRRFVYPPSGKESSKSVINEIKLLFQVHTDDITQFVNKDSDNFSVELFCVTTNVSIATEVVDITDIITIWKTKASNGETGADSQFKTMQFTNMWDKNPDFDCIRKLNITNTDTNVALSLSTIQYICYNPVVYT